MQTAATDIAMPELPAVAGGTQNCQLDASRDSPVVDIILEDPDVAEHTSSVHNHGQHSKAPTKLRLAGRHPAPGEQGGGSSGPAAGVAASRPGEGPQATLAGARLCGREGGGPARLQAQGQVAQRDQRLDEIFQLELEDDEESGCSIIWEPVLGEPAVDAGWQVPGDQADLQQQQQQQGLAKPLSSSGQWGAATSEDRLPLQGAGALAGVGSGASPSSLLTTAAEQQQALPGAGPAAAAKRATVPVPGMTPPAADPGYHSLSQTAPVGALSQMSEPDCPFLMECEGAQHCTWQPSWKQGTVCCDRGLSDDDCSVICVEGSATRKPGAQLQQKAAVDGPAALPGSDSAATGGLCVAQQPTASSWDAAWETGEAVFMFALGTNAACVLCMPLLRGSVGCEPHTIDLCRCRVALQPAAAHNSCGGSMPHLHCRGDVFLECVQTKSSPHDKLPCAGSDMEVELVEEDQAAAWEGIPACSTLPVASAVALCRGTGGRSREEWMATVVQVRKEPWWAVVHSTRHGQLHQVWQACLQGVGGASTG